MIEFSGTSYFGLQRDEAFLELVRQGISRFGLNNPISRLADEDFTILEEAESQVASELNCEAACLLSSGYLAGIAAVNCLARLAKDQQKAVVRAHPHHPCLSDAGVHVTTCRPDGPALLDLSDQIARGRITGWCAVLNFVNSFCGGVDVALHSQVAQRADLMLMDVSHSVFVLDHSIFLKPLINQKKAAIVFVGSLGKAAAFPAGFVAGSREFIDRVRRGSEYTAASPPARSIAFAFVQSSDIRRTKRLGLSRLKHFFESEMGSHRSSAESLPVYCLGMNCEEIYRELLATGMKLSFLPYPSPDSDRYLRLVLNASHQFDDVARITKLLRARGLEIREDAKDFTVWQMPGETVVSVS